MVACGGFVSTWATCSDATPQVGAVVGTIVHCQLSEFSYKACEVRNAAIPSGGSASVTLSNDVFRNDFECEELVRCVGWREHPTTSSIGTLM